MESRIADDVADRSQLGPFVRGFGVFVRHAEITRLLAGRVGLGSRLVGAACQGHDSVEHRLQRGCDPFDLVGNVRGTYGLVHRNQRADEKVSSGLSGALHRVHRKRVAVVFDDL